MFLAHKYSLYLQSCCGYRIAVLPTLRCSKEPVFNRDARCHRGRKSIRHISAVLVRRHTKTYQDSVALIGCADAASPLAHTPQSSCEPGLRTNQSSVVVNLNHVTFEKRNISQYKMEATIDNIGIMTSSLEKRSLPVLDIKRILQHRTWNYKVHGDRTELWASIKVALFLQCIIDHCDVAGALQLLDHLEEKAKGSDKKQPQPDYVLKDLGVINQLLYSFSAMQPKNLLHTLKMLARLADLRERLCCASKADITTVYGLLLILVRHWTALEVKDTQAQRYANVLKKVVRKEIQLIVAKEKLDLGDILVGRQSKYKGVRGYDAAVVAQLNEIFPEVEPKQETVFSLDSYASPLFSDYACAQTESEHFPRRYGSQFSAADLKNWCTEQRKLEEQRYLELSVLNRTSPGANLLDYLCKLWECALRTGLQRVISELEQSSETLLLRPFFKFLDFELLVKMLLFHLKRILLDTNPNSPVREEFAFRGEIVTDLIGHIMTQLSQKYFSGDKVFCTQQAYLESLAAMEHKKDGEAKLSHRELWHKCHNALFSEQFNSDNDTLSFFRWPVGLYQLIGGPLLELIIQCAWAFSDTKLANFHFQNGDYDFLNALPLAPALTRQANRTGESTVFSILPTKSLRALLDHEVCRYRSVMYDVSTNPMISPPVPRMNTITGGNLNRTVVKFMRFDETHAHCGQRAIQLCPEKQLAPVYDALNNLSSVPWKINKPVLDVCISFCELGSEFPNLSVALPKECWPTLEAPFDLLKKGKLKDPSTENEKVQRAKLFQRYRDDVLLHQQMRAKSKLLLKKMTLIHWVICLSSTPAILSERPIWFPANLDFRGRVYPTAVFLNHIGRDMDRGLLLFAEGRPLGGKQKGTSGQLEFDGLDWLKIHLANLQGKLKKCTLAERVRYSDENMQHILETARDPLSYNWWKLCEKPWQTLATCIEISNAVNSGSPENYICHLPVHQDGSCNGLQHYAALGRDFEAAVEVNLADCGQEQPTPGDIYQRVADAVEEQRHLESLSGNPIAKLCEGLVTRYGVRQQIEEALRLIVPKDLDISAAAQYLSRVVLMSINKVLQNSRLIEKWLEETASCLSSDFEQLMQWRTPLGLPVIQPYYRHMPKSIETETDATERYSEMLRTGFAYLRKMQPQRPLLRKQVASVSPNFIHSLDSTHMMLTCLYCERAGITFVSVHDSYWTHPCDVGLMNRICREQFYKLHCLDLLGEVARTLEPLPLYELSRHNSTKQIEANYLLNLLQNRRPSQGSLNLKVVTKSVYFFS